jgi:hypothetical protein
MRRFGWERSRSGEGGGERRPETRTVGRRGGGGDGGGEEGGGRVAGTAKRCGGESFLSSGFQRVESNWVGGRVGVESGTGNRSSRAEVSGARVPKTVREDSRSENPKR